MTHILLARHPETEANVDGRFVGRGDSPLTERGVAQLTRLSDRIASFAPDIIWTSPLARALCLAETASATAKAPIRIDERLVELDFGQAEGLTWSEIEERGIPFDYRLLDSPVAPGGESRADIQARSVSVADELVTTASRHAVCTHGGVFRAMLVHLLGLSRTDIWAFHIHNGSVAEIRVTDGHGTIEEFVAL